MTGYESKRAAARDKLDDDDTQVYKDHGDALTIAYQSGYYDGKKAAQPAQEPVAWLCSPDENGLFELPTTHKACKDCFPVYTTPPQPAQEREALKLALEVLENLPGFRADIDNAITAIKEVLEKTHEN